MRFLFRKFPLVLIFSSKQNQHNQPLPLSFFLEVKMHSQSAERMRRDP